MGLVTENLKLSEQLLAEVLEVHRKNLKDTGRTNFTSAKDAGEVALLYGFDSLLDEFRRVLKHAELGLWTRLRHPRIARDPMRKAFLTISTFEQASKYYPYIGKDYFREYPLNQYSNDDFGTAFHCATEDYEKQCVLVTQVFHGQFTQALDKSASLAESGNGALVRLVATIEAFRRRKFDLAKSLFESLPDAMLCDSTTPQIAMGICGRAAWGGYPYADY